MAKRSPAAAEQECHATAIRAVKSALWHSALCKSQQSPAVLAARAG